ncbi:MAG TPA: hypothetical protein DCM27_05385 [Rhodospirillaceae bacterium]|nr:hypothetical protein [Rhodospirillaceae bacterium]
MTRSIDSPRLITGNSISIIFLRNVWEQASTAFLSKWPKRFPKSSPPRCKPKLLQDIFPGYLEKHLKPDPEQIAILEELSSRFKTCVTSNGMRRNVENSVRIAGLSDIFRQNIFTAEQVASPKPAPDLILYAAERMGVSDLSRVLHIEDAVRGAQAGLAAGATVIGITKHAKDKNKSTAELQNAGVQHVFDNWADIADFALKL